MSSLFRKKLSCFYCGRQVASVISAQIRIQRYSSGRVSQFTCLDCGADNHLDENGEILDYTPAPPTSPAPVFARRRQSPRALHALTQHTSLKPPPEGSPPPSPPFCRTCLHNQQIVTNAIATYDLPPEDHPDYDHHVHTLFPQRRRELEERWPPVCNECAPKVNDRIRNSNYQVKVASLGQMLARSSGEVAAALSGGGKGVAKGKGPGVGGGWRVLERVVWWIRGAGWCYFHFLVLVWHGSAVLHAGEAAGGVLEEVGGWTSCAVRTVARGGLVDAYCYGVAARQARNWIPWSLVTFFWVYKERDLQRSPHKKLVGSREYFKLECCVYVFRMASWYLVAPGGGVFEFTEETFSRLHLGLFFLSLMLALFSITCLKLEDPPAFSLREPSPIPSTPSPPASPPQRPAPQQRHPMSPITPLRPPTATQPPSTGSTVFSPVKFRARDISPSPAPRRTPASPDAMDWNPTSTQSWHALPPPPQPSFTAPPPAPAALARAYTSPFTGTLPPAPRAPIHRLLTGTPSSAPSAPAPQRENFFRGSSFAKVSAPTYRLGSPQYAPMAPQRFFIPDETTGLETLMGGSLRLSDDDDAPTAPNPSAEESWALVVARCISLILSAIAVALNTPVAAAILAPICATARSWTEAGAVAAAAGAAVAVHQTPGVVVVVLWVSGREVWGVLMRLQRARARAFYEREREKERRERSVSEGSERSAADSISSERSVGSMRGRGRAPRGGTRGGGLSGMRL